MINLSKDTDDEKKRVDYKSIVSLVLIALIFLILGLTVSKYINNKAEKLKTEDIIVDNTANNGENIVDTEDYILDTIMTDSDKAKVYEILSISRNVFENDGLNKGKYTYIVLRDVDTNERVAIFRKTYGVLNPQSIDTLVVGDKVIYTKDKNFKIIEEFDAAK